MAGEGEPVALRGGGESVDNNNSNKDDHLTEDGEDNKEGYENGDNDGEPNGDPDGNFMACEGEPVALRGGGENVINSKNHDAYIDNYRVPDKYGRFDEEHPYALQGGGLSMTFRTTRNETLIQETHWAKMRGVSARASDTNA